MSASVVSTAAPASRQSAARGGPVQPLDLHTAAKAEFLDRFTEQILAPRGFGDHVVQFPGPAGTLAVEAALKLAHKVTGRQNVIAFTGGFHGASLGALAATSSPLLRGAAGVPLRDVTILPYGEAGAEREATAALERALRPGSDIAPPAAILLETVQGEGGLHTASPAWPLRVRELADAVGALVVVDDIQAGCGRTGTFFSFEDTPGPRSRPGLSVQFAQRHGAAHGGPADPPGVRPVGTR